MKLKCNHCGYEWDYNGNHPFFASCPKCLRKVSLKNRRSLLTIEGVRKLLDDKFRKEVEEQGYNWKEDILHYIEMKENAVRYFNRDWDKQQLQEAKNILKIIEQRERNE